MSENCIFLIYCLERYRYAKHLSGKEAAKLFKKYDLYSYIMRYFESLHTMGEQYIIQDIDAYISDEQQSFWQPHSQEQQREKKLTSLPE